MCRIIVECSTITGSTAYSASGILVKNANFPEEADRNRKRLPSGGRHQSGQSTVLLKNVVPVEGTASCVFVERKPDGLTAYSTAKPFLRIQLQSRKFSQKETACCKSYLLISSFKDLILLLLIILPGLIELKIKNNCYPNSNCNEFGFGIYHLQQL